MEGYLKANFKNEQQELHELSLEDCDFITEDEEASFSVLGRKHICPRCGCIARLITADPYCMECNWDSLTDLTYEREQCVA